MCIYYFIAFIKLNNIGDEVMFTKKLFWEIRPQDKPKKIEFEYGRWKVARRKIVMIPKNESFVSLTVKFIDECECEVAVEGLLHMYDQDVILATYTFHPHLGSHYYYHVYNLCEGVNKEYEKQLVSTVYNKFVINMPTAKDEAHMEWSGKFNAHPDQDPYAMLFEQE